MQKRIVNHFYKLTIGKKSEAARLRVKCINSLDLASFHKVSELYLSSDTVSIQLLNEYVTRFSK